MEDNNVYFISNRFIHYCDENIDEDLIYLMNQNPNWNSLQTEYQDYYRNILGTLIHVL